MGEAKRRRERGDPAYVEQINQLTRALVDQGKIIEAGFVAFARFVIPPTAPDFQREAMRVAFLAGAQHLWGSINSMLDADAEPTEADLKRMELIADELQAWTDRLRAQVEGTAGSA